MFEPLFTLAALAILLAYPTGTEPLALLQPGSDRAEILGVSMPAGVAWTLLLVCAYTLWTVLLYGLAGRAGDPEGPRRLGRAKLLNRVVALGAYAVSVFLFHFPLAVEVPAGLTLSLLLALFPYLAMAAVSGALGTLRGALVDPGRSVRAELLFGLQGFAAFALVPLLFLLGLLDVFEGTDALRYLAYVYPGLVWVSLIVLALGLVLLLPFLLRLMFAAAPLEPGPLRARLEALCRKAEVRVSDILVMPTMRLRFATALVAGFPGRLRYIMITDHLLEELEPEEVECVVAHELGHAKKNHLPAYLCFIVASFLMGSMVVETVSFTFSQDSVATLLVLPVLMLFWVGSFSFMSRRFESEADVWGAELTGDAIRFAETLERLGRVNRMPADVGSLRHFSIQERIQIVLATRMNPVYARYTYGFGEMLRKVCLSGLILVAGLSIPVVVTQAKVAAYRDRAYHALSLAEQGRTAAGRGDHAEAEMLLATARETLVDFGIEPLAVAKIDLHLARSLAGQGRLAEARRAIARAEEQGLRSPGDRLLASRLRAVLR